MTGFKQTLCYLLIIFAISRSAQGLGAEQAARLGREETVVKVIGVKEHLEGCSTFVGLLGEYVKALEEFEGTEVSQQLQFHWSYSWSIPGGFVALTLSGTGQIGWRWQEAEMSVDVWRVVITPYFEAFITSLTLVQSNILEMSSWTDLDVINLHLPLTFAVEDRGACFSASIDHLPINFNNTLDITPYECSTEIIEDLVNENSVEFGCNALSNFKGHTLRIDFTDLYRFELLPYHCISLD
ncbi:unnamed protein product [Moneuplotes crassus]|uniref:Uncharacterized protein n=1 Tax=Euplotes crassus TaxID=5936 RepID=A0AAD2D0G8_EUPCR|nr:unnamed protein product [Moneuplotes crassus]